jgi:hypothetical protein
MRLASADAEWRGSSLRTIRTSFGYHLSIFDARLQAIIGGNPLAVNSKPRL